MAFQFAKALTTAKDHEDADVRERAEAKIRKWARVWEAMWAGTADYGSAAPFKDVPKWATMEVVTGGFATGKVLSGGPVTENEASLFEKYAKHGIVKSRKGLNRFFLTEEGLEELDRLMTSSRYAIEVPEEACLLIAAWLVKHGASEKARDLIDVAGPYFDKLRFFPTFTEGARKSAAAVHLQTVGETLTAMRKLKPNARVSTQKEAVNVWLPYHDRVVGLLWELFEDGVLIPSLPEAWIDRAKGHLARYEKLRMTHRLCSKPERKRGHQYRLRVYLRKFASNASSVPDRDIADCLTILNCFQAKWGEPDSKLCMDRRRRQRNDVASPLFSDLNKVVVARLEQYEMSDGVDQLNPILADIDDAESERFNVPSGAKVPIPIREKMARCENADIESLIAKGVITSGEMLANVIPQMTSQIRALGFEDPGLREIYAKTYRAFRKRRSLLLLNLQKQTQLEDLPWIAIIEDERKSTFADQGTAKTVLRDLAVLTLTSFPHMIIPNKLIQEMTALIHTAGLEVRLTEELAADIFMGEFSKKYLEVAKHAANFLDGTLYANYYHFSPKTYRKPGGIGFLKFKRSADLATICAARAGARLGTWRPAVNGAILEQQLILTTHNLAVLFEALELGHLLKDQLLPMARHCFRWLCKRLQTKVPDRHMKMIAIKNAAYAWRQMVFYLSFVDPHGFRAFQGYAESLLAEQNDDFQKYFRPFLDSLIAIHNGGKPGSGPVFLGWSIANHR